MLTKCLVVILAAVGCIGSSHGQARPSAPGVDEIIFHLAVNPGDFPWILELGREGKDDPRVIPLLKTMFSAEQKEPTQPSLDLANIAHLRKSQYVAVALMKLGVPDRIYLDELSRYGKPRLPAILRTNSRISPAIQKHL